MRVTLMMAVVEYRDQMRIVVWFIFLITFTSSNAQDSFYNYIEPGPFDVGYSDSLIYDKNQSYHQYGYNGPTPIFLDIWYPIQSFGNDEIMTFGDFRIKEVPYELEEVYRQILSETDAAFVNSYFLTYEVVGYDVKHSPADFGSFSNVEVLETLKTYKTRSQYLPIKRKLDYPVIVYHHGAQSSAEENFLLAEFFASKGYIVVSASYQLPYENKKYGFEPEEFDDTGLPKRVIEFASTLTTNDNVYFIGHSAGAQVGFRFLHESGLADGFISMETTTEFWRKSSIKKGWKDLYRAVIKHRKDYDLPILMIANTGDLINPFPLYNEIANAPMVHASSKVYFDHESYTSVYHLRHLFRELIPQADIENLKSQLDLYIQHLKLIEEFLLSLKINEEFRTEKHDDYFFFSKFNMD